MSEFGFHYEVEKRHRLPGQRASDLRWYLVRVEDVTGNRLIIRAFPTKREATRHAERLNAGA